MMDPDFLENCGEKIVSGILLQDLTAYIDLLNPTVLLRVYQDQPPTANNTTATVNLGGTSGTTSNNNNTRAIATAPLSNALEGPMSFAIETFPIFDWLQRGPGPIAQPTAAVTTRRPKKDNSVSEPAGGANAQQSVKQPAGLDAAHLQSQQAAAAGGGANDNMWWLAMSKVTVTYGRSHFLFRDECYFDEGLIVVVERWQVPPEDSTDPLYQSQRASFAGESTSRIRKAMGNVAAAPSILDFTFCEGLQSVLDLLRIKPAHGKLHKAQAVGEAPGTATAAKVVQGNNAFNNLVGADAAKGGKGAKGGGPSGRVLIKARNKKGEEEAYEFADEHATKHTVIRGEKEVKDDALTALAELLASKYDAEALKLTNTSPPLQDVTQLVPVLRSLVANSMVTLSWLDLSCNGIVTLPSDLGLLPLTTLYLHGNQIRDWAVVDTVAALPLVSSLTLHGNPISNSPQYRMELLGKLCRSKTRKVPPKTVDFVAVSRQDLVVCGMHEQFTMKKPKQSYMDSDKKVDTTPHGIKVAKSVASARAAESPIRLTASQRIQKCGEGKSQTIRMLSTSPRRPTGENPNASVAASPRKY